MNKEKQKHLPFQIDTLIDVDQSPANQWDNYVSSIHTH